MRDVHSEFLGSLDLRAKLSFYLRRLRILRDNWRIEWQVALIVKQTRHFVFGRNRSPAEGRPFAVQRLVDTEIKVWMRFREVCGLEKPWAGNKNARRGDPAIRQRLGGGAVHGVIHAEIVRMND